MAKQTAARERVLDAFAELLIEQGERAATLDAVAAAAGVSKGGLLYHFGSKEALVDGLIERLSDMSEADTARMLTAPEGVVEYFVRTSVDCGTPFDRTIIAVARLAQGQHAQASEAMADIRRSWLRTVEDAVGDPDTARAIVLMSDGLYANTAQLGMGVSDPDEGSDESIERLLAVIARLLPAGGR
ncbi:TetR family transcriptional regulator [Plantibacter flavus]|uniref:TetR/AcrR family transcriptional regulator n=1 Tax=Plantibacter flavus TaxID=150123 RepID=UPI00099CF739|nr:TetR/AcrR family transcriptional regulator [Plantibacter flavus]AQX79924.1 TetR family transcriptional regulator [Plantibacter flavus]